MFIPVLDKNNKPLMPCHPARARELLKSGKAIKRWYKGVFAIKLIHRTGGNIQQIAVGIDPGSKREAFTVKSNAHTYLNIQTKAITHVKDKVESRKSLRLQRRQRKTPYRKCRLYRNRGKSFLPPSTRARWNLKLRILNWLSKIFPISDVCVEDVKVKTAKKTENNSTDNWNLNFAPIEVGKNYFYKEIIKKWKLHLKTGLETSQLRKLWGLNKTKKKLAEVFEAHCVDSWCLANWLVGGHTNPDSKKIFTMNSLNIIRRQLHTMQPIKHGIRYAKSGTRCFGFEKGSIVKHRTKGLFLIGGIRRPKGIVLNYIDTYTEACQVQAKDLEILSFNRFVTKFI